MKSSKQLREKLGHDIKDHCRGYHNLSCSELSVLLDSVREEYKGMIEQLGSDITKVVHTDGQTEFVYLKRINAEIKKVLAKL